MNNLRIAILGVGRIGSLHAEIVAHGISHASLAGVSDIDAAAAHAVATRLGTRALSLDEALHRDDIDAVAVCTSTDSHVDVVQRAAQAGKAIFCEKPISLLMDQVNSALTAVSGHDVAFMVGFNRRFDPSHEAVRAAVTSGDVGDPHIVRITSRDPAPPPLSYLKESGGIFLDMTVHDFDMARFITGSEVIEVFALASVRVDPAIGDLGDYDTAVVNLRHQNGCLSVIDNSRQATYGYDQRVEVFGSLGMASSQNWPVHSAQVSDATGLRGSALQYFFLERYRQSYLREWQAFVDSVNDGVAPPVTGNDGRAALVLGLAARRSVEEGRPVLVSEFE